MHPSFAIALHKKDKILISRTQSFFGCGNIKIDKKNGSVVFYVNSIKDLMYVIIPHFIKYPLISQKRADFELFKQVVGIMNKKEHLTIEGLHRILAIRASINLGLSDVLKTAFPNIIPVERPKVTHIENIEPNWIAGFVDGEGCFDVKIYKSKTKIGFAVQLRFRLVQHSRDHQLMNSFIQNLGCGNLWLESTRPVVNFSVYPGRGAKSSATF